MEVPKEWKRVNNLCLLEIVIVKILKKHLHLRIFMSTLRLETIMNLLMIVNNSKGTASFKILSNMDLKIIQRHKKLSIIVTWNYKISYPKKSLNNLLKLRKETHQQRNVQRERNHLRTQVLSIIIEIANEIHQIRFIVELHQGQFLGKDLTLENLLKDKEAITFQILKVWWDNKFSIKNM